MTTPTLRLVIVTGLSGAGKSTVVRALEDLGYFCVDNLPIPVLGQTLDALLSAGEHRVALGLDARSSRDLSRVVSALDKVRERGNVEQTILFLDAKDELLGRRFNETRRPHPLTKGPGAQVTSVLEAVALERELLAPLRARAGLVEDTTELTVHDLRRLCFERFGQPELGVGPLRVRVLSFGFKYGIPQDADMVLDVRFLPNPYFQDELRALSGQDEPVQKYVFERPEARSFLEHTLGLLRFCLPLFQREGKSYLTIAIGCTGGRHRSVALVEALASELGALALEPAKELGDRDSGIRLETSHRDIRRGSGPSVDRVGTE